MHMVNAMRNVLHKWKTDPAVHTVIIDSDTTRAFCSGGDVKFITAEVQAVCCYIINGYAINA